MRTIAIPLILAGAIPAAVLNLSTPLLLVCVVLVTVGAVMLLASWMHAESIERKTAK